MDLSHLDYHITRSQEQGITPIILIYGPTGCGKTSISLDIAKQWNGEIISVDARQVYRGMDIGTGKITPSEMEGIPHHMLDIIDPNEVFSVVEYQRQTLPIIESIHKRGKTPILCG
jgi:tRNA dimethylallyltransferase